MQLGFFKEQPKLDFINRSKLFFAFSSMCILCFVIFSFTFGYNLGIDFKGGIVIEIQSPTEHLNKELITDTLNKEGINDFVLKDFNGNATAITISSTVLSIEKTNQFLGSFKASMVEKNYIWLQSQFIGPSVSSDLIKGGLLATLFSLCGVFIYLWVRFDWQYGLIAFFTLLHNALVCMLFLSIFRFELNLSAVAAILTVIGYSVNDTVVLFDQVRENTKRYFNLSTKEILNRSINQTLSRSLATSITVLLVVVSVFVFGGETLRSFSFVLIIGCIFGTYASICLAVPMLGYIGDIKYTPKADKEVEERG